MVDSMAAMLVVKTVALSDKSWVVMRVCLLVVKRVVMKVDYLVHKMVEM